MSINVENFQTEVLERSHSIPVLVDFWASWCSPCRVLGPILERLEQESGNSWLLAKVDTDRHQNIAAAFGISSIPNVKLFHQGTVVDEFIGALPEFEIVQWLKKNLPGRKDTRIELASSLLAENRLDDAKKLLTGILQEEPEHQQARTLLARCVLLENPEEARRLTDNLDDVTNAELVGAIRILAGLLLLSPDDPELPTTDTKKSYIAAIQALRSQNYNDSLEQFIRVIRDDRYYHNDGARKACIAIFKLLGDEHPVTQQYRREFSSALYV